jgi:hypothetical protein
MSLVWLWFTLIVGCFDLLFDAGAQQIWIVICGKEGLKGTAKQEIDSGSSTPPVQHISEILKAN